MPDPTLLHALDKIGTVGLAFIVFSLMRGWLVTKREMDRELARGDKLEARLDKALDYGDRALGAGEVLRDKLPAKR
jgi:hypothetical protein